MKKDGQKIVGVSLRFMNARWMQLIIACLLFFVPARGWTAPQQYANSRSAADDINVLIRQLKTGFADLRNDVRNHEVEIRTFESKLHNQESSFDHLRQQIVDDVQSQKDFVRASTVNLDGKIVSLEQSLKNLETVLNGVVADLRQMKGQANDSVGVLSQYRQKITELESQLDIQKQQMTNFEMALNSMLEVFQARENAREISNKANESSKVYKVQPGDTLEKIAKSQGVTLQALRDANNLSKDNNRIIVNQVLILPR